MPFSNTFKSDFINNLIFSHFSLFSQFELYSLNENRQNKVQASSKLSRPLFFMEQSQILCCFLQSPIWTNTTVSNPKFNKQLVQLARCFQSCFLKMLRHSKLWTMLIFCNSYSFIHSFIHSHNGNIELFMLLFPFKTNLLSFPNKLMLIIF